MERLRSHDERGAHRVERKFLKIITCLLGENLVYHESLVAPSGSLQLPGGGEPQLGLTVHDLSLCAVRCLPSTTSLLLQGFAGFFFFCPLGEKKRRLLEFTRLNNSWSFSKCSFRISLKSRGEDQQPSNLSRVCGAPQW